MAAAMAVVQSLPGRACILLPDNLYFNVVQALDHAFVPHGITYKQARRCPAMRRSPASD